MTELKPEVIRQVEEILDKDDRASKIRIIGAIVVLGFIGYSIVKKLLVRK